MDLWRSLDGVGCISDSWLVQGDFNIVLRSGYKIGVLDVDIDYSNDFDNYILRNGLAQLRNIDNKYTWSNNWVREDCIWAKMDYSFVNVSWFLFFWG